MKKLPSEIVILGNPIKIEIVKDLKNSEGIPCDGIYNSIKALIQLEADLKGNDLVHTFFHEYGHAIIDLLGIHNVPWFSYELEEILVDSLGRDMARNFNVRFRG